MINKAILVGNVGGDPEIRSLDNDTKVATFSLATSERYQDKSGQKQERTEWHRVVAWRGLAGIVEQYVRKGMKLYIEGKITYRQYKDKDGNDRYTTEIVANEMKLLDSRNSGQPSGAGVSEPDNNYQPQPSDAPLPPDDLPF